MTESRTINFLREFPAWCVILVVFVFVFLYYIQTHDGFVQRLVDAALGSLFTALVSSRPKSPINTGSTDSGDVIVAPEQKDEMAND